MKTRFENAIELREPGKFVFDINPAPGDGEIVRVDGRVVERRSDGRYELDHRPSRLDAIVVERCAGPHYTPPVRWVLARAAYRNTAIRKEPSDAHEVNIARMRDAREGLELQELAADAALEELFAKCTTCTTHKTATPTGSKRGRRHV